MTWFDPWLQLIDDLLQWDRWRGCPSDARNLFLAPSPPPPELSLSTDFRYAISGGNTRQAQGTGPSFLSLYKRVISWARSRRQVQAGGFTSLGLNLRRQIRSFMDHLLFGRVFPRRRTSVWCPYCEKYVQLGKIVETENDQLACPDCRFFLVEKEVKK